jgi:hypothetical protein
MAVIWDKTGQRYGLGAGLRIFADGKLIEARPDLGHMVVKLPPRYEPKQPAGAPVNFAVNNEGTYYPRVLASFAAPRTSAAKVIDGNYWYHRDPPNRWTCEGSSNPGDSIVIEFGVPRGIQSAKFYFLDDGSGIVPPREYALEYWDSHSWKAIPHQKRTPGEAAGRQANVIRFPVIETAKIRAVFVHAPNGKTGLTELELWGDASLPVEPAPHPAGNLAYNPSTRQYPKASASYSDRFGGKPALAIDGKINFLPTPTNRWTSYESPNESDWFEVDFGAEKAFNRVELAIYDDRGGVQPPKEYRIEYWDGTRWRGVTNEKKSPRLPTGGEFNEVRIDRVTAGKVRVVFQHAGKARSGLSECLVWNDND